MPVSRFHTGSKSSIPANAVPLTASGVILAQGVQIFTDRSINGTVYCGYHPNITAAGSDHSTGFPLASGDSLFLPVNDPTSIFVLSSPSGQKVYWIGF